MSRTRGIGLARMPHVLANVSHKNCKCDTNVVLHIEANIHAIVSSLVYETIQCHKNGKFPSNVTKLFRNYYYFQSLVASQKFTGF